MEKPWVSVICTCFQHAPYVQEAMDSVLSQTYPHVQLIVVDNASTDGSSEVISKFVTTHSEIIFIPNKENRGICKAFNEAVPLAKGKYLIDLAADDLLLPNRIADQVAAIEKLPENVAILYGNVEMIDAKGTHLGYSLPLDYEAPSGDVFSNLLEKHFLPSPSTMFRKEIFLKLGGYNEALSFEDFDYWIRCARDYPLAFLRGVTTKKRVLPRSLSSRFYNRRSNKMLESTLVTFQWAFERLRNEEERKALTTGASYYFRQSVLWGHFDTASKFYDLLKEQSIRFSTQFCVQLWKAKLDVSFFYQWLK